MRIFKILLSVFILLLFASFIFFKKDAIACEMIGQTHFSKISTNLYVDDSLDEAQKSNLIEAINDAIERVSNVYGNPISSPRIIATTEDKYSSFGFNPTGMQASGFFRECIFLGPKGLNTDVIAHEFVHAEVRYRTGPLVELTQLPAWFIEGTGIKVDYRRPFLLENIEITEEELAKVKSIFFLSDFPNTSVKYYQASRIAVEPMHTKSLYSGLERLNNGEKFEVVFRL
ncbi:hypothetical protein [Idiomarina ramblicola]|uniref:Peptidase MA-like domain-containing protein n=1 Tax=Idiomarina ramblicola TaxID=263724 RepID=A0A432Z0A6_9GAMM|nr:hypothetical protein [Idiomarina ramblicola]RUO69604.1 hypothetical protein CWI78_06680 [Idiomarina ramblicola]